MGAGGGEGVMDGRVPGAPGADAAPAAEASLASCLSRPPCWPVARGRTRPSPLAARVARKATHQHLDGLAEGEADVGGAQGAPLADAEGRDGQHHDSTVEVTCAQAEGGG
jgi:hypothetical protein